MNVSLVTILLQLILIGIIYAINYDNFYKIPLLKTKRPRYIMRGKLAAPEKPNDYCQSGLCPPGVVHLACKKPFWSQECTKPRDGLAPSLFWMVILSMHNTLRTRLSISTLSNLPRARFLPPLRWNEELSQMGMRITNYCNDEETTQCVNTPHFLHVSRNSVEVEKENMVNLERFCKDVIIRYFMAYVWYANPEFVESYPENPTKEQKLFANVIFQENTHVGCGILMRAEIKLKLYITCVYNKSVKPGQRLYDIHTNETDE